MDVLIIFRWWLLQKSGRQVDLWLATRQGNWCERTLLVLNLLRDDRFLHSGLWQPFLRLDRRVHCRHHFHHHRLLLLRAAVLHIEEVRNASLRLLQRDVAKQRWCNLELDEKNTRLSRGRILNAYDNWKHFASCWQCVSLWPQHDSWRVWILPESFSEGSNEADELHFQRLHQDIHCLLWAMRKWLQKRATHPNVPPQLRARDRSGILPVKGGRALLR